MPNKVVPNYVCDICGKSFKVKSNLKEHMSSHSDARSFLCGICGKSLKNRQCLNRHLFTHGVKQTCTICNRNFANATSLGIHQREKHGLRNWKAPTKLYHHFLWFYALNDAVKSDHFLFHHSRFHKFVFFIRVDRFLFKTCWDTWYLAFDFHIIVINFPSLFHLEVHQPVESSNSSIGTTRYCRLNGEFWLTW